MEKDILGGVLCLNKPAGVTSHDMVYKVRKLFNTKQVGHTGTLDPMATGVLVMMVGRAVKASEFLSADSKEYLASIRLGVTTNTEDTDGTVLSEYSGELPDYEKVCAAAKKFEGEILQTPPMYSALKVGGQKLVDLARKGKTVEREARAVRVDKLEVFKTDEPNEFKLLTRVSKGTYIRTLCADIGAELGVGAAMSSLCRISCGAFGIEDSLSIEQLSEMSEAERISMLHPIETLFDECPSVTLTDFFSKLARSGCEIYQKKLGTSIPNGTLVKLYDSLGFIALAKASEYEAGSAIKSVKMFRI